MTVRSQRILVRFDWPDETVTRLVHGPGPLADLDGNIWHGCSLGEDLDLIEQALNGEAYTLNMTLANISPAQADLAWLSHTNDQILGAGVRLMIQRCDASDQPVGSPDIMFTGRIDNIVSDDVVEGEGDDARTRSTITVEVTNRFTLRRRVDGSVLSDADQKSRSLLANPGENPDRFCDRVPLMLDKTITWPRWN